MRILVVCTGNVCRSPVAALLLDQRLAETGVVATVSSAGTHALVGEDMTAQSRQLGLRYAKAAPRHEARQLTPAMVQAADLVLTMTREQRGYVAAEHPSGVRRIFTLREFARLAGDVPAPEGPGTPSIEAALRVVAQRRGAVAPPSADAYDIPDPYRRSQARYDEVGRLIDNATRVVAESMGRILTAPAWEGSPNR